MAFRKGDNYTQAGVHTIGYYVNKIVAGDYTLHGMISTTSNDNSYKYPRNSQEAHDNARLIFDILMDPDVASYYVQNGKVEAFWAGSPAAANYYNFGDGGSSLIVIPGITQPEATAACEAFIENPLNPSCQAGEKQPGLYPVSGNGNYYTAVCAILGYIDIVSGLNPWHSLNTYVLFDGIGSAVNMGTQTPPNIYTQAGFSSSDLNRFIDPTCEYDYPVQFDSAGSFMRPWIVRWSPISRQQQMEYGLLGLTCPISINGYSRGIPLSYNNAKTRTTGNIINFLEQIWFDILGLPRANGNLNGNIQEGRSSDHLRMRGLGIPYYSNGYGYFPFTAAAGNRYYNNVGSQTSASAPPTFENNWQYWNGTYTKRAFSRNMIEYRNAEKWGTENMLPPFSTPTDYEVYPWCIMTKDGDPEGAVLDLIHSIQTWRLSTYWTAGKIQNAQTAARYWYNHFIAEHKGGGGPSGQATPAGRQEQWKWGIYQSAYLY